VFSPLVIALALSRAASLLLSSIDLHSPHTYPPSVLHLPLPLFNSTHCSACFEHLLETQDLLRIWRVSKCIAFKVMHCCSCLTERLGYACSVARSNLSHRSLADRSSPGEMDGRALALLPCLQGGHAHAHQALPMLDAVAAGSANASTRASGPRARQVACALAHLPLLTEILFRFLLRHFYSAPARRPSPCRALLLLPRRREGMRCACVA
jgi:hypothetical protein